MGPPHPGGAHSRAAHAPAGPLHGANPHTRAGSGAAWPPVWGHPTRKEHTPVAQRGRLVTRICQGPFVQHSCTAAQLHSCTNGPDTARLAITHPPPPVPLAPLHGATPSCRRWRRTLGARSAPPGSLRVPDAWTAMHWPLHASTSRHALVRLVPASSCLSPHVECWRHADTAGAAAGAAAGAIRPPPRVSGRPAPAGRCRRQSRPPAGSRPCRHRFRP